MEVGLLNWRWLSNCFPKNYTIEMNFTSNIRKFQLIHILAGTWCFQLLLIFPIGGIVESYWCFSLNILHDVEFINFFMFIWHVYILFDEVSIFNLRFFFLLLSFENSFLYSGYKSPPFFFQKSVLWVFSEFLEFLFILLISEYYI